MHLVDNNYSLELQPRLNNTQCVSNRIFQRGGGGHTVSNIMVMAFSPRNIVGCFLKESLTKGGGPRGVHRTPLATPLSTSSPPVQSLKF